MFPGLMRALVAVLIAALVGLAVQAHDAAASSSQTKKPGVSVSVDLGPVSVDADVSTAAIDASVDVSTPAASVDATVAASPTAAPVSAAVTTSTPVAGATTGANNSTAGHTSTGTPVHVTSKAKGKRGSTTVKADTTMGSLHASAPLKSPGLSGNVAVGAGSGNVDATARISTPTSAPKTAHAAQRVASAGRRTAVGHATQAHRPAATSPAPNHVVRRIDSTATARPQALSPKATTTPNPAPRLRDSVAAVSRSGAAHRPGAAAAPAAPEQGPSPAPVTGSSGGAAGSGVSTAGFFAILSALLMLAAPLVARWLRSTSGLALQPVFASLPERPG